MTKFKMSEMVCDMKIGPFWVNASYSHNELRIKSKSNIGVEIEKDLIKDFIENLKDIVTKYEEDPTSGIMSDGADLLAKKK